jgi:putative ABC transport system ATP-binding protein
MVYIKCWRINMQLSVKGLKKIYKLGEVGTLALNGVDLDIEKGDFIVVLGPSGSGKTTLLNILGGLDSANEGLLTWDGKDISKYSQKELTFFRRENVGFVFQGYNLLPNLTVKENVESGAKLTNTPLDINQIVNTVGLSDKLAKFPYQLSGGEQQRVSIARALAKNPKILFCDEPTGALDEKNSKTVLSMIQKINQTMKTTVFIITHNLGIAEMAHKVIKMRDGRVIDTQINTQSIDAEDIRWA